MSIPVAWSIVQSPIEYEKKTFIINAFHPSIATNKDPVG